VPGDEIMIPFWVRSVVKAMALPPTGPMLIALVGIAILGRHPRRGRALVATGVVLLLLLAMPGVAALLVRTLDRSPPLDLTLARSAQAIVILGGGTRNHAPEYGGATLGTLTLERVRYGARVARETGLPVLVAGGAVRKGKPIEAVVMRDALVHEFGVPVRWMETRSRDTHENAVNAAAILKASGVTRAILVAHSFDVPRATAEFRLAGLDVIPAPTSIPPAVPDAIGDWVPSPAGLGSSYYALYEILGYALFRMTH
jgi:uncharacterized SAM-binding protein YcdF (DUF218 family)